MKVFVKAGSRLVSRWSVCVAATLIMLSMVAGVSLSEARPKFSAIAVDARRGTILFGSDVDGLRHPASLTKMMTLYVLFQDLKAGRIKLKSSFVVSRRASSMPPSKLGLKPGSRISVDDAIRALVTKSANDVASTIGENLGGSEANFAARMTRTARSIGMSRTTFRNASGLPNPDQWTTARDMATLGLRLQRDFPQYYPYFRITAFSYKGRVIRTHNRLLGRYAGTDGIKTGYIAASGFNLTTSAKRGDKRIVGVVLGARSGGSRNAYMMSMLDGVFKKCVPGNTIAAKAGSSAGAINPLAVASKKPAAKATVAGDIEQPAAEQSEASAIQSVTADPAPPASDETRVLEAKMEEAANAADTTAATGDEDEDGGALTTAAVEGDEAQPALPANLPFQVKSEAEAGGEVLASAEPATAWAIQIGAFPDKANARQKLAELRSGGYSFLNDKSAVTVEVQNGDQRFYRARFIGFTQKSAKAACTKLEKRGLECLTMSPQAQS